MLFVGRLSIDSAMIIGILVGAVLCLMCISSMQLLCVGGQNDKAQCVNLKRVRPRADVMTRDGVT